MSRTHNPEAGQSVIDAAESTESASPQAAPVIRPAVGAQTPQARLLSTRTGAQRGGQPVHIDPKLGAIVAELGEVPEDERLVRERRDLNEVVHRMLIVGLAISTVFMVMGIVLDVALGRSMPTTTIGLSDTFGRVIALRPSGFLMLGLLVLIATPVLRVVGSIAAFIYERDWRYAGITLVVFLVVMLSLILGRG